MRIVGYIGFLLVFRRVEKELLDAIQADGEYWWNRRLFARFDFKEFFDYGGKQYTAHLQSDHTHDGAKLFVYPGIDVTGFSRYNSREFQMSFGKKKLYGHIINKHSIDLKALKKPYVSGVNHGKITFRRVGSN